MIIITVHTDVMVNLKFKHMSTGLMMCMSLILILGRQNQDFDSDNTTGGPILLVDHSKMEFKQY